MIALRGAVRVSKGALSEPEQERFVHSGAQSEREWGCGGSGVFVFAMDGQRSFHD